MKKLVIILSVLLATGCNNQSKEDIIKEKREEAFNLAWGGHNMTKIEWKEKAKKAIELYAEIINLNPTDVDVDYNDMAMVKLTILNDYKSAEKDYTKALEYNSNNSDTYYYRGKCKYELHNYDGAIIDFTKAFELNPYNLGPVQMRGIVRAILKQHEKAIEDFTIVINFNPEYYASAESGYYHRGFSKYELGDKVGACNDWNQLEYSYEIKVIKDSIVDIGDFCDLGEGKK